jgi:hypothetical protein
MPDIEKRLESFVRIAHSIIIFPGGAGTAEELLYILGIMMHPDNKTQKLPIILTGPSSSIDYFNEIADFVEFCLGAEARELLNIIPEDPVKVAQTISSQMEQVREYRKSVGDAYQFNWTLKIDKEFQSAFEPTHENMAALDLHLGQEKALLAANLRRAFSGIVAGNIKEQGIAEVKKNGKFLLRGDTQLMLRMDKLLEAFVAQGRMKLPGSKYEPCYQITA